MDDPARIQEIPIKIRHTTKTRTRGKQTVQEVNHKERLDEKVKQERTEPDHHRKIIIKGITVYESFRPEGSELWDCLLQSMGKH